MLKCDLVSLVHINFNSIPIVVFVVCTLLKSIFLKNINYIQQMKHQVMFASIESIVHHKWHNKWPYKQIFATLNTPNTHQIVHQSISTFNWSFSNPNSPSTFESIKNLHVLSLISIFKKTPSAKLKKFFFFFFLFHSLLYVNYFIISYCSIYFIPFLFFCSFFSFLLQS